MTSMSYNERAPLESAPMNGLFTGSFGHDRAGTGFDPKGYRFVGKCSSILLGPGSGQREVTTFGRV